MVIGRHTSYATWMLSLPMVLVISIGVGITVGRSRLQRRRLPLAAAATVIAGPIRPGHAPLKFISIPPRWHWLAVAGCRQSYATYQVTSRMVAEAAVGSLLLSPGWLP